MENRKYKLGDKYRSDFDYDGMMAYGLKKTINENTSITTLTKLHNSFEDVNFSAQSAHLWSAMEKIKAGDKKEAKSHILAFKNSIEDELNSVDLFEDYDNIPANVKVILDKYNLEDADYEMLGKMLAEVEAEGYTFDYGLDAEAYNLRKIKDGDSKYEVGGEIKVGYTIMPYPHKKELVIDKVYKNKQGETSYAGKFDGDNTTHDFILNKKDKITSKRKLPVYETYANRYAKGSTVKGGGVEYGIDKIGTYDFVYIKQLGGKEGMVMEVDGEDYRVRTDENRLQQEDKWYKKSDLKIAKGNKTRLFNNGGGVGSKNSGTDNWLFLKNGDVVFINIDGDNKIGIVQSSNQRDGITVYYLPRGGMATTVFTSKGVLHKRYSSGNGYLVSHLKNIKSISLGYEGVYDERGLSRERPKDDSKIEFPNGFQLEKKELSKIKEKDLTKEIEYIKTLSSGSYAKGGGVGDEISIAMQYGKILNDLNKEKQFNKRIDLNSTLNKFVKQNEISIDNNDIISIKGNKVAYIDKINAKTGQPKSNWEIKKYANGGGVGEAELFNFYVVGKGKNTFDESKDVYVVATSQADAMAKAKKLKPKTTFTSAKNMGKVENKYAKGSTVKGGVDFGINYNIVFEKPDSEMAWKETINANSLEEAKQKFNTEHPKWTILNIFESYAKGSTVKDTSFTHWFITFYDNTQSSPNNKLATINLKGIGSEDYKQAYARAEAMFNASKDPIFITRNKQWIKGGKETEIYRGGVTYGYNDKDGFTTFGSEWDYANGGGVGDWGTNPNGTQYNLEKGGKTPCSCGSCKSCNNGWGINLNW